MQQAIYDLSLCGRGIILLLIVVIIGVMAAEKQINSLTGKEQPIQSFNIQREQDGVYRAYLFGETVLIRRTYTVGSISSKEHTLYITVGQKKVSLPTLYRFSFYPQWSQLVQWGKKGQQKWNKVRTVITDLAGFSH